MLAHNFDCKKCFLKIKNVMFMVNMTLSVPDKIHVLMKKYPEIKWSEISRQAIVKKLEDLEFLTELKEIENSEKEIKKGNYLSFEEILSELGVKYEDL